MCKVCLVLMSSRDDDVQEGLMMTRAQGNVLKMGLLGTFSRRWTFAYCNN